MIAHTLNAEIIAAEDAHTSGVYPKRGLAIVRGQGATLWDAEERAYIDCVGGQGAANLGHAHPAVVAAIQQQAATLISCPEIFHNDQRASYLEELVAVLPAGMERVFLCNSGAEAVEAAIKAALVLTGRRGVVATVRGFHGRTLGALSATWEPKYREPFLPLIAGFQHIPYDKIEALDAAVNEQTAAVMIELVQGEGGVRPASHQYVQEVARMCRERGALLIVDEVQTGFGRTGALFACQHYEITPDLLTLAKSMAGGVPMGALGMRGALGPLPPGSHGSTFGGNPLACAAARATLRALCEERLPEQAAEKGAYVIEKLAALRLAKVREVRGVGLLIGLELKERVQPHLLALMERGVLALPAGPNVLRLLPPLVISYAELDQVVAAIADVLGR
ncbi:MAG: acetylornithine/succinylornithine family transaminase [Roseiflexaceae bacterium]|nr:acetylornithine/succinylornithine family transaminase [Roseiflexaceae bacterium]